MHPHFGIHDRRPGLLQPGLDRGRAGIDRHLAPAGSTFLALATGSGRLVTVAVFIAFLAEYLPVVTYTGTDTGRPTFSLATSLEWLVLVGIIGWVPSWRH